MCGQAHHLACVRHGACHTITLLQESIVVGEGRFSVVFEERCQYNERGYARRVMRAGDMPSKASMAGMEAERKAKQEKEHMHEEKEVCWRVPSPIEPMN